MVSSNEARSLRYPAYPKTSYASQFEFPEPQPVFKFHNFASVVLETEDKLAPRCFPHFALHVSPHRILDYERSALGFGPTGAEYVDAEQCKEADAEQSETDEKESCGIEEDSDKDRNISKPECDEADSRNQEDEKTCSGNLENENLQQMAPKSIFDDIPQHILDAVTENLYKSTTRKAAEECALAIPNRPVVFPSIIGNNEERDLYHSVYQRTGTWKTNVVPETWERAQERPLYEDPKAKQYRPCRLRFSKSKSRLFRRQHQRPVEVNVTKVEAPELVTSTHPTVQHIRPSPGYAGFVPKLPVMPSPPRDPRLMCSSSARTYRFIPKDEFRIQQHAHRGPLSKLVTTTTPCNPFNKTIQTSQLTSGLFII